MARFNSSRTLAALTCAVTFGCAPTPTPMGTGGSGGSDGIGGTGGVIQPGPVTYHRQIREVIESNCLGCHVSGGIAPFPLDSWASVSQVKESVVAAVSTGDMPPWPASEACRQYLDSRALPQPVRDLFISWRDNGYPEGDPADYLAPPPPRQVQLGPPTLTLDIGGTYTPPANTDQYQCFLVGTLPVDTYLSAIQIIPGVRSEVHHVQLHRVNATDIASLQNSDRLTPELGYGCGAGIANTQNMFSYRPGSQAVTFEPGDAAYIKGGSGIMLQIHYNTSISGLPPAPDRTRVSMWTLPAGQVPNRVVYRTGMIANFNIPAGAPNVVARASSAMSAVSTVGGLFGFGGTYVPGEIIGMTPHAHQIASRMAANIQHSSGQQECLVEIPKWDFDWQLDYMFETPVPYSPTDTMNIECDYDNSTEHQPIINGVRQQPRNVTWGERSIDEMCLHYIWLRFDRQAFLNAHP